MSSTLSANNYVCDGFVVTSSSLQPYFADGSVVELDPNGAMAIFWEDLQNYLQNYIETGEYNEETDEDDITIDIEALLAMEEGQEKANLKCRLSY